MANLHRLENVSSSVKQQNEVNNYSIIRQGERCVKWGRISGSLAVGNGGLGVQD